MEIEYDLGTDGRAKADQKCANLLEGDKTYLKESDRTGSGSAVLEATPPFYEQIDGILGKLFILHIISYKFIENKFLTGTAHNFHPAFLGDAVSEVQKPEKLKKVPVENNDYEDIYDSDGNKHCTENKKGKRSNKNNQSEKFLELLVETEKNRQRKKEKREEKLDKLRLEKEALNQTRYEEKLTVSQQLVNVLQKLAEKKRKRRRSSSSDYFDFDFIYYFII